MLRCLDAETVVKCTPLLPTIPQSCVSFMLTRWNTSIM